MRLGQPAQEELMKTRADLDEHLSLVHRAYLLGQATRREYWAAVEEYFKAPAEPV